MGCCASVDVGNLPVKGSIKKPKQGNENNEGPAENLDFDSEIYKIGSEQAQETLRGQEEFAFKEEVMSKANIDEITYSNGDRYYGQVESGKRQGYGILVLNKGEIYEGGFHEDQKHIKGRLTYSNGDQYYGDFEYDK